MRIVSISLQIQKITLRKQFVVGVEIELVTRTKYKVRVKLTK